MFFILSGFVIKYSWEKSSNKSFKKYFLRRFLRIYIPLFFIFLLAYVIKSYTKGSLADPEWKTLLGEFLYAARCNFIKTKRNFSGLYG